MQVLLLAPPGAGKGTQGVRIAHFFGIEQIAMGDILRDHVERETDIGKQVKQTMDNGDLVPDELVMGMLREPVDRALSAGGYVLDGFPRTIAQAEQVAAPASEQGADAQLAVFLDVEEDELVRRLLARAETEGRDDDDEATIRKRLSVYREDTAPLVDWYRQRGQLVEVDGALPVDDVSVQVLTALAALRPFLDKVPEATRLPVDLSRADP